MKEKKNYKKQFIILSLGVFGSCFLLMFVNFLIDPYAIYFNYDKPTNLIRPEGANNTRLEKLVGVIREKPEIIFLGSSVTNHGYALQSEDGKRIVEKYGLKNIYNAALSDGRVTESRHMLEHAIANNPNLKEVILGLEIMGITDGYRDQNSREIFDEISGHTRIPLSVIFRTLLSWDAIVSSIRTFSDGRKFVQFLGNIIPDVFASNEDQYKVSSVGGRDLSIMLIFCDWQAYHMKKMTVGSPNDKVVLNQNAIEEVRKIVQIAKDNDIKLNIVINTTTPAYLRAVEVGGMGNFYRDLLSQVTEFSPVLDFISYDEFWDNDIVKEGKKRYFVGDALHFPPYTGSIIMDKIFANNIDDVLVTKNSLKRHNYTTNKKLNRWLKKNSYSRRYLEDLDNKDPKNPTLIPSGFAEFIPQYVSNYKGFVQFKFMGNIYSVSEKYAPYDLLQMKILSYPSSIKSFNLEQARSQIDKRKK